jgi:ppGpp synthetase/RelA/SpoT-type nucleotidyltranferase
MKKQQEFFDSFNISRSEYNKTGLKWNDLQKIYEDYLGYKEQLETFAIYVFNSLMKAPSVHSVRYRIKNPEHLIEKIIRKRSLNPKWKITLENYKRVVTDLIGLRALHLFKDGWEPIHSFINKTWELHENPIAYHRTGDSADMIDTLKKNGCTIKEHKYGYRSIHYLIESKPDKNTLLAEIQVRTIFEEAWSEIDHTIRYPYEQENKLFKEYLFILNRLAGGADEMGSFIKNLQSELEKREVVFQNQLQEKNKTIEDLRVKIAELNLKGQQYKDINSSLEKLRVQTLGHPIYRKRPSGLLNIFQISEPGVIELDETQVTDFLRSRSG